MDISITKQVRSRTIKTEYIKKSFLFNNLNNHFIKAGISACLKGELVRYDGKEKYSADLFHGLEKNVSWQPVCPEMHAGLGVPRPAVQLIETSVAVSEIRKQNTVEARGVANPDLNVTHQLRRASDDLVNKHRHIHIWLLKARSPSCGYLSTPLYSVEGKKIGKTSGLFAEHCQQYTPWAAIFDETALQHKPGKIRFYLCALLSKDILHCPDHLLAQLTAHYQQHHLLSQGEYEQHSQGNSPQSQLESQALAEHGFNKIRLCQQVHQHVRSWSDTDAQTFNQRWCLL